MAITSNQNYPSDHYCNCHTAFLGAVRPMCPTHGSMRQRFDDSANFNPEPTKLVQDKKVVVDSPPTTPEIEARVKAAYLRGYRAGVDAAITAAGTL